MYMHRCMYLSLSLYIYIYIYMYERERERERNKYVTLLYPLGASCRPLRPPFGPPSRPLADLPCDDDLDSGSQITTYHK